MERERMYEIVNILEESMGLRKSPIERLEKSCIRNHFDIVDGHTKSIIIHEMNHECEVFIDDILDKVAKYIYPDTVIGLCRRRVLEEKLKTLKIDDDSVTVITIASILIYSRRININNETVCNEYRLVPLVVSILSFWLDNGEKTSFVTIK